MDSNRQYYYTSSKNQATWREKKEAERKKERDRMIKLARRERIKRIFHRIKIVSVLCFFITLFLLDAYCVITCVSYLNKPVVVTEVGHEIDIGEYKPTVGDYDTSWLFDKEEEEINWNKVGEYRVKFVPKLFGISRTLTISVVDTTPPEIKVDEIGEDEYFANIDDVISRKFVTVDNYDGDITQNTKVDYFRKDGKNYSVFYTAKDSSGNETVLKQEVKIATGLVALTFDDGPSNNITPKILDLLKKYDVKATFFIGNFEGREDIIKREYEEGHTIGFHGYSHDYSIYKFANDVLDNFKKVEDMYTELTGDESSKIIRFPGGSSNTVSKNYCLGVMSEVTKMAEEEGYIYYDWNVDSDDAGSAKTAEEIVKNVTSSLKIAKLNVVLMHDAESKEKTLEALEEIINYCKQYGYVLVNLKDYYNPVHHGIAN